MTPEEFKFKVEELKPYILTLIDSRVEKFIKSGCTDLNDYENNYLLPKMFISAVANEIEYQFRPYNSAHRKEVRNIAKYL